MMGSPRWVWAGVGLRPICLEPEQSKCQTNRPIGCPVRFRIFSNMSFFLGHFLTQNFGHFPTLAVSLGQFLPKIFGHFPPVNFGQIPACNFGHFMSARYDSCHLHIINHAS